MDFKEKLKARNPESTLADMDGKRGNQPYSKTVRSVRTFLQNAHRNK